VGRWLRFDRQPVASGLFKFKLKRPVIPAAFRGELGSSEPQLYVAAIELPIVTARFGSAVVLAAAVLLGAITVVFTSASIVLGAVAILLGSVKVVLTSIALVFGAVPVLLSSVAFVLGAEPQLLRTV
jgi:hypothetical protein